jgi:hypothetical protein
MGVILGASSVANSVVLVAVLVLMIVAIIAIMAIETRGEHEQNLQQWAAHDRLRQHKR